MAVELPLHIKENITHFSGRTWLLPKLLDWLGHSDEPLLLLTGLPGTGKSMVVAWLAGAGLAPADPTAAAQLAHIRDLVKGVHFCVAGGSITPHDIVKGLVGRLTESVPGFGKALLATAGKQKGVTVKVRQRANSVSGSMTGVVIERLELGDQSPKRAFDQCLRDPLCKLYEDGYEDTIILLVDSLDEGEWNRQPGSNEPIVGRFLAEWGDLPAQVRVLTTARPDPRITKYYDDKPRIDLIDNASSNSDDIYEYGLERLSGTEEELRITLARKVARASQGIFLYAHLVLRDFLEHPPAGDLEKVRLPTGLAGIYSEFLNRELGGDEDRWFGIFKPILGLIAVAQGDGLVRHELAHILSKDPDEIEPPLRRCSQYMVGMVPDGPFRLFHQSFTDFLLEEKANKHYHIDALSMHRRITEYYLAFETKSWVGINNYGLNNLALHLHHAGNHARLIELINKLWMETRYEQAHNSYSSFRADVDLAWQVATTGNDPNPLTLIRLRAVRQIIAEVVTYDDYELALLAQFGHREEALDYVRDRDDPREQVDGFLAVYSALQEKGQQDPGILIEAVSVAKSIRNDRQKLEALQILVRPLLQAEHYDAALDVGRSMPASPERATTLCDLYVALDRAKYPNSDALYADARSATETLSNPMERLQALDHLAKTLIGVRRYDMAREVVELMPNGRTRTEALCDLAYALPLDDRSVALDAALAAAETLPVGLERVEALCVLAQRHWWRSCSVDTVISKVRAVVEALPTGSEHQKTLTCLAETLFRTGRYKEAQKVAESLLDEQECVRLLSMFARDLAGHGCPDEGRDLALLASKRLVCQHEWPERDWRMEDLYRVVWYLIERERYSDARSVAEAMPNGYSRVQALNDLAQALEQAKLPEADTTFAAARSVAEKLPNVNERIEALHLLADTLTQTNRPGREELFAAAQVAVDMLPEDWQKRDALRYLVPDLIKAKQYDAAQTTAQKIADRSDRALALFSISVELPGSRRDEAITLFNQAISTAKSIPRVHRRRWTLGQIAKEIAKTGWHDAQVVFDAAFQESEEPLTCPEAAEEVRWIIKLFARYRDLEAACAVAEMMPTLVEQTQALHILDAAQGEPDSLLDEEGHSATRTEVNDRVKKADRCKALSDIVEAMVQTGSYDDTWDAIQAGNYDQAQRTIKAIGEDYERAGALCLLTAALVESRHYTMAQDIVTTWPSPFEQAWAFCVLAETMAISGLEEAGTVLTAARSATEVLPKQWRAEDVDYSLGTALVWSGRLVSALNTTTPTFVKFLQLLARWGPALERMQPGLAIAGLREALSVAAWVSPNWRKIHELLTTPSPVQCRPAT